MHEIASQKIKLERYGDRTKLTMPYRSQLAIKQASSGKQASGDLLARVFVLLFGFLVGGAIFAYLWQQNLQGQSIGILPFVIPVAIIGLTLLGLLSHVIQSSYLRSGRTYSWVIVGKEQISFQEASPLRFSSFSWDALKICRMRITQLPKRFESGEDAVCPSFWNLKAVQQSGQMALLAQDENGRLLYPIAVGYPQHVLVKLAVELQKLLDQERREHWRNVIAVRPDLPNEIEFPLVPIIGDQSQALPLFQELPAYSRMTVQRTDSAIEIKVPWSSTLEEVTFTATRHKLHIKKRTLLGEISIPIPSGRLIELSVYPMVSDEEGDLAFLKICFINSEFNQVVTLELLHEFSYPEVCWVGSQLSRFAPRPVDSLSLKSRSKTQFRISQLLILTAWVAIFCACIYADRFWGWVYALQIMVFLMIGGAMLGYRPLGQPATRSWTSLEITLAFVILGCLWIIRLLSLFST